MAVTLHQNNGCSHASGRHGGGASERPVSNHQHVAPSIHKDIPRRFGYEIRL